MSERGGDVVVRGEPIEGTGLEGRGAGGDLVARRSGVNLTGVNDQRPCIPIGAVTSIDAEPGFAARCRRHVAGDPVDGERRVRDERVHPDVPASERGCP